MEKKVFVRDLNVKEEVESIFFVKHLALMEARDGRSYLNMILSDASGDLEGRKWHGAEEIIATIKRGDYVNVAGKVNLFQNRMQLILTDIVKIDESDIQEADFVASSQTGPDVMFNKLIGYVELLDDVYIRDLLNIILYDTEIQRRIKRWSAAKTIHHAYHGGLLEHILSCVELGMMLAEHYKVNKNYVVAGAILHDLAKIYELTDGPLFDYTEEGKLIGHLGKGIELLDRYCARLNYFPYDMKLHLKHIILSHHGEYAYGSPALPLTVEAFLVHFVDLIDSKVNSLLDIKKKDNISGHWSAYIKHLDRMIFKSDLPYYKDYVSELSQDVPQDFSADDKSYDPNQVKLESPERNNTKKRKANTPLTQNLSSKLKGFKIESEGEDDQ